jgi:hypothetical protein
VVWLRRLPGKSSELLGRDRDCLRELRLRLLLGGARAEACAVPICSEPKFLACRVLGAEARCRCRATRSRSPRWCSGAASRSSWRCRVPRAEALAVQRARGRSPSRVRTTRSRSFSSDRTVPDRSPSPPRTFTWEPKPSHEPKLVEVRTNSVLSKIEASLAPLQFRSGPTHLEPKLQTSLRVSLSSLSSKSSLATQLL